MSQCVLVTGYAGYIGAALVPLLVQRDHRVIGVDSHFFEGCDLGPLPKEFGAVERRQEDVRDLAIESFAGVDAIVHLAALSNDPLGKLNRKLTDEINHRATVRIAGLARRAGVQRFLFSSSCSLYGASSSEVPLTEEAPFNPLTAYGRSKVDAEEGLSELASDSFSPVYLRNATAYGVTARLRGDLVVQDLVGSALLTGRIEILSDGTPWRPLVHVEDIARAFVAMVEAPRETIHNRAFNVGRNGENYTIAEVAEIVRQAVPGSEVVYAPGGGPDKRSYRVDFGRITREVPGFEPSWTVAEGVEQIRTAYLQFGLQPGDLRGDRFTRLERLRELLGQGRLSAELRWQRAVESVRVS